MAIHFWAVAEAAAEKKGVSEGSEAAGYAAGLATWLLAGSVFVAVKAVCNEMPPWMMCFLRSLISAVVLLPFAASHRHEMIEFLRKNWLEVFFIGAIGLGLTQGLIFTALGITTAVNVGIVFALGPMFTMVIASIVLREDMNGWQGIGSAIAFCGVVLIAVQGSFARLVALQIGLGDLVALGSAVFFAGYTVLLKRAKFKLARIPLLVILLFGGSLGSLPFALWEVWNGEHSNLALRGYLSLLYCGVLGGSLMYFPLQPEHRDARRLTRRDPRLYPADLRRLLRLADPQRADRMVSSRRSRVGRRRRPVRDAAEAQAGAQSRLILRRRRPERLSLSRR